MTAGILAAWIVAFVVFAIHNARTNDRMCEFLETNKLIMGNHGYLEVHRPDGSVVPLRPPRPKRSTDWPLVAVYTIGLASVPSIELIAHRVGPMTAGAAVALVLVLLAAPGARLAERLPNPRVVPTPTREKVGHAYAR